MSDTRTIIVETNQGLMRIENIPSNAKVTFGPVQPGKGYPGENALRIYTAASNQLAVVLGVKAFRDASLTITRRQKVTRTESKSEAGPDGATRKQKVEHEWVDVEDNFDN